MKTLLFDFDGTLVDSMPTYGKLMLEIVRQNNLPGDPQEILRKITPLGFKDSFAYFISLGATQSEEEMKHQMTAGALEAYSHSVPAKNNVVSVIKKLSGTGFCINVLTASPHITLDICLKRLGIYDKFKFVWSCEDFNTNKANPDIYKLAAEKIGVPVEDILFLDDNIHAITAAKNAGCKTCGVYDVTSAEKEEDMRKTADYYIKDFSELLSILEVE